MTPHLTLEELIDDAREHAGCQRCRDEADAWAKVRAGVRLRDNTAVPPAGVLGSVLAELDQPPSGRRYLKPLSAAAAVAVLAAGGYGAASALRPSTGGTQKAGTQSAELTATGCTGVELAGGTLVRTTGSDLVISTITGHQLTVSTTNTTAIYREVTGTLGDIRDGERVLVNGSLDGDALTATSVSVLPDTVASPATPSGLGIGLATGTVADAHHGGFTVVQQDGTRLKVTVAANVTVIITVRITVAQLITGKVTSAVGTAGADGTLTATTVEQDAVPAATWQKLSPEPPKTPAGLPTISTPAKPALSLNGLGCSGAAITTTYLLDGHLSQ